MSTEKLCPRCNQRPEQVGRGDGCLHPNCPINACNRIESYNFECEAGPLKNCTDWTELKKSIGG